MIEIRNLNKSFSVLRPHPTGASSSTKTILKDFSLSIPEGTFLGISGESGAGKSTLLSIITGLQKADSGKVTIDGTEITALSDKELCAFRNRNIGFISQEQSFLENLTVLENVKLPALLYPGKTQKELTSRAQALLEQLNIAELAQMYPSFLSGGENQRVLIARALINEPKILVADEPTDAVSEKQTKEILQIFKDLSLQGKTVILVSHDTKALEQCDRIVTLG